MTIHVLQKNYSYVMLYHMARNNYRLAEISVGTYGMMMSMMKKKGQHSMSNNKTKELRHHYPSYSKQ